MAPLQIDEKTRLTSVTCTEAFFTFNYELAVEEIDLAAIIYTEKTITDNLIKSVNSIAELQPIRDSEIILGYTYKNLAGENLISIFFG
jgi:hypothetical protein